MNKKVIGVDIQTLHMCSDMNASDAVEDWEVVYEPQSDVDTDVCLSPAVGAPGNAAVKGMVLCRIHGAYR